MTAAASSITLGVLPLSLDVADQPLLTTVAGAAASRSDDNDNDNSMLLDDNDQAEEEEEEKTPSQSSQPQPPTQPLLDFTLAKCKMPPAHEFDPVQTFVAKTILEQHQLFSSSSSSCSSSSSNGGGTTAQSSDAYRGLLDLLRHRKDVTMLTYILLALRTSDHGNTLNRITSSSAGNVHARLVHQLVRFNPFFESSLNHESDHDDNYALADAHLSLLIAIVSKKTLFLIPAMTSLWKMLVALQQQQQQQQQHQPGRDDAVTTITATTTPVTITVVQEQPAAQTRRLHAALATLIRLVPKAKTELFGIILSNCPYPTRHVDQITWYYQQALHTLHYVPSMRNALLQLIIQKCLNMDVEIKITDHGQAILDDDDPNDDGGDDIFDFEVNNSDDGGRPVMGKRRRRRHKENEERIVDEMADKLDSLMLLLFEYVEQHATSASLLSSSSSTLSSSSSTQSQSSSLQELYLVFWDIFERGILCTHKSKFVQFILLHICSLDYQIYIHRNKNNSDASGGSSSSNNNNSNCHEGNEECSDDRGDDDDETMVRDFAIKLVNIIVDPYRSSVTRQAGACYLASFISRCKCIGAETVCEAVCALLRWAETYIQQASASASTSMHQDDKNNNALAALGVMTMMSTTAPDAREQCNLHALFYTICQAAFYIICFRGKEAIQFSRHYTNPKVRYDVQPRELIDIRMPRWTRLVAHATLQPLRHCLESVRLEFLHVARLFHLVEPNVLERLETMAQVMMTMNDKSNSNNNDTKQSTARTRGSSTGGRLSLQRQRKKPGTKIATAAMVEKERVSGGVGGLGKGTNPLDSFFPFDPYLLRRSHAYIEPHYNHWNGSLSAEDYDGSHDYDENDVYNEDEVEVDDDDLDVDAATVKDDDDDGDDHDDDDDTNMMSHEDGDEEETENSDVDEDVVDEFAATSISPSPRLLTQPMVSAASIASATNVSSSPLPDYMVKREELRKAWSVQHDRSSRPRSGSIENGSW
jgi:RNA polymerase I-specific transcription initiation factor RRN3